MSNFSNNLKNYRLLRGLTQKELSEKLYKSLNAIAKWERGISIPDADILIPLCKILQCTPNQILGWDESPELNEFLNNQEKFNAQKAALIKKRKEIDDFLKAFNAKKNSKEPFRADIYADIVGSDKAFLIEAMNPTNKDS